MNSRLFGKVAVITGGSRGLGFAIAKLFASEGCGIVITGRSPSRLSAAADRIQKSVAGSESSPAGVKVEAHICDVRDPVSVDALFADVKRQFGHIDILVNNAGIAQPNISIAATRLDLWREVIDTNLNGLFYCTRAAIPLMRSGGTILNNLSAAAKTVFPKFAAYNASKHGGLGFTLSLREELIPLGIRVVALMPGATDTQIWDQFWPDAPRERMIPPESVAEAALYAVLLPPEANLSELVITPASGAL